MAGAAGNRPKNARPLTRRRQVLAWTALAVCGIAAPGGLRLAALASEEASGRVLQREGTPLSEHAGRVRLSGNRWEFIGSDGTIYPILENLALQRMVLALKDDPEDRYWTVEGQLTECLGENYLLMKRIVRTGRSSGGAGTPLPESPANAALLPTRGGT